MNWNKIKEKCPKGYEKYALWQNYQKIAPQKTFFIRDLYDFFDEQGIYIEIRFNIFRQGFGFYIIGKWKPVLFSNYNTRTEAEEKAFEKAFEILEDKLN